MLLTCQNREKGVAAYRLSSAVDLGQSTPSLTLKVLWLGLKLSPVTRRQLRTASCGWDVILAPRGLTWALPGPLPHESAQGHFNHSTSECGHWRALSQGLWDIPGEVGRHAGEHQQLQTYSPKQFSLLEARGVISTNVVFYRPLPEPLALNKLKGGP